MKPFNKKISIVVSLLLSSFLFTYCSVEDSAIDATADLTLTTDIETEQENTNGLTQTTNQPVGQRTPCSNMNICDPNYVFPVTFPSNGSTIQVTYPATTPLEDIHCIRYEYFSCYSYLRMSVVQDSNPRKDTWITLGDPKPGDDLDTTVCNDPRVQDPSCDDD